MLNPGIFLRPILLSAFLITGTVGCGLSYSNSGGTMPERSPASSPIQNPALGDGRNGALIVTENNVVINTATHIIDASVPMGSTSFSVSHPRGFAAGDEILIFQSQDSAGDSSGKYEFARISSITANMITISEPLDNSYVSGTFSGNTKKSAQIVLVPNFTTVTIPANTSITAPDWDGFSGGVVAFRSAGPVNIAGTINATGKGVGGDGLVIIKSPATNGDGIK